MYPKLSPFNGYHWCPLGKLSHLGLEQLTSVLLCRSIVDPHQHATIIEKADSGAPNSYWYTEDMRLLLYIKYTHNGTTVWLANNANMNSKNTRSIPLSGSLFIHAKKVHIFNGLHRNFLISVGKLCDNICIAILDKNEINIRKYSKIIVKGHRNKEDVLW